MVWKTPSGPSPVLWELSPFYGAMLGSYLNALFLSFHHEARDGGAVEAQGSGPEMQVWLERAAR